MEDFVSVIICCKTCYMRNKNILKTQITFQVFVYSEPAAKSKNKKTTKKKKKNKKKKKKKMTKHSYRIKRHIWNTLRNAVQPLILILSHRNCHAWSYTKTHMHQSAIYRTTNGYRIPGIPNRHGQISIPYEIQK